MSRDVSGSHVGRAQFISAVRNLGCMRVLVVEDEPPDKLVCQRRLEEESHAVDVATDGPEGLWLATENQYAAIVLDVMLPGIDGFELCRKLRTTLASGRLC